MNKKPLQIIEECFEKTDREAATELLSGITTDHVMANSEQNLLNTQISVLKLAEGNINKLSHYVECAQKDFRDVILWGSSK